MGWIQLAPEDREKYGAPEQVPLEYGRWGLKSIDALEAQVGWTLEDLTNELQRKKRDAAGNVVTRDELDDDGEPVLGEDGKPKQVEVSAHSPRATLALVWLCLRAAGICIPWDDFDVQPVGLRISWANDDEGKAEEPTEVPPA